MMMSFYMHPQQKQNDDLNKMSQKILKNRSLVYTSWNHKRDHMLISDKTVYLLNIAP